MIDFPAIPKGASAAEVRAWAFEAIKIYRLQDAHVAEVIKEAEYFLRWLYPESVDGGPAPVGEGKDFVQAADQLAHCRGCEPQVAAGLHNGTDRVVFGRNVDSLPHGNVHNPIVPNALANNFVNEYDPLASGPQMLNPVGDFSEQSFVRLPDFSHLNSSSVTAVGDSSAEVATPPSAESVARGNG